jgi:hypothetical protein
MLDLVNGLTNGRRHNCFASDWKRQAFNYCGCDLDAFRGGSCRNRGLKIGAIGDFQLFQLTLGALDSGTEDHVEGWRNS